MDDLKYIFIEKLRNVIYVIQITMNVFNVKGAYFYAVQDVLTILFFR